MANEVYIENFMHGRTRKNQYKPDWFHHPIHDVESIWWIALWSFYFLQVSSDKQKQDLFPESGIGFRPEIWRSEESYGRLCTQPPAIIQDLLFNWLTSIKTEHESLQAGFDKDATYRLFDYNKACAASVEFLQDIQIALKGT
jgi:hypothetical protein